MDILGRVDSLWRYPVKSMRGEELGEGFVGFAGVYGDRLFAFKRAGSSKELPYLTGREQGQMLLCQPRFRYPGKAVAPPNLAAAEAAAPGLNPIIADAGETEGLLRAELDVKVVEYWRAEFPALKDLEI